MENVANQGLYKKVGMAVSALFTLMIIGFFVFVYYDVKLSTEHPAQAPQAEQVEAGHQAPAPEGHGDGHTPAEPAKEENH